MIREEVWKAALAGLLHDIGKFAQRAGVEVSNEWKDGSTKADFGYQHALHTFRFIEKYLPAPIAKDVNLLAAYHHRPKGRGIVVQLADRLAAGERRQEGEDDSDRKIHPRQLHPVFIGIRADDQDHPDKGQDKFYFPLKKLALEEAVIFPTQDAISEHEVWEKYESLWNDFCAEAEKLKEAAEQSQQWEVYLENMLSLLQRYTWCIPAAYFKAIPDVSLYDHSRMTAALAACLAEFDDATLERIAQNPEQSEEPVALLVGGDISGVQDFIYTITNKGATSALRGRSFYLQLLTEAVARFVLRELELPYTSLIYGGGGNFYLLARVSDTSKLSSLRQKLSRILYTHHQGDLYIAVEGLSLRAKDFVRPSDDLGPHPLSEKWGELSRLLAVVKNQRFAELDLEELQVLFEPQGHGGNVEAQCIVCGREFVPVRAAQEEETKCAACQSYETLGRELRDAQYIGWKFRDHPAQVAEIGPRDRGGVWQQVLKHLGFEVVVCERLSSLPGDIWVLWALKDRALEEAQAAKFNAVLVRRLLVNANPKLSAPYTTEDNQRFEAGEIKPFEKLAKDSKGIPRLGIFRADVDNLGKLFSEGFGQNATLSRIASLSFLISLFFEGWVGKVAEEWNQNHGERLYAIYSGGDDLFFVGSWDEVVEFAWAINEDLKRYTAHPGIHLSGGIALATSKYPLAKAAQDAARAEETAKNILWWDKQGKQRRKNVLSFLGQPLPWEQFGDARELKEKFEALEESKRMSVLRKILFNYALYAEAEEKRRRVGRERKPGGKPQPLYGPWNWRIVYLLRRTFGKAKEEEEGGVGQQITRQFYVVPGKEGQPDYTRLDWVGVAARWTELLSRQRD